MRPIPLTVFLASCVIGGTPTSPTSLTSTTPSPCATGRIGAAGGELVQDGVVLTIPAGALAADTDLELCTDGVAPAGLVPASLVVETSPVATALAVPAQLTLPHGGGADAALWASAADGSVVRQLRGVDDGVAFSAPLYRLGTAVVAPDPRGLETYVEDAGATDLLFVVDCSCSMLEEQAALAAAFPEGLLDPLLASGIDFHVGVVSTDLDTPTDGARGRLRTVGSERWIEGATADPAAVFDQMVSIGNLGSSNEQGLGATYTALEVEAEAANAGFLRPAAHLGVVVVSDENDYTPLVDIGGGIDEFSAWFDGLEDDPDAASFHGIVGVEGGSLLEPRSTRYLEVIDQVGGLSADIHDADWVPFLADVVDSLVSLGMTLAAVPYGTVEAWVLPGDGSEPWLVDPADVAYDVVGNRVRVDVTLAEGDEVEVLYLP